jgi:SET domain-containing protein
MQEIGNAGTEGVRIVTETAWLIFKQSTIHGTGGFARRDIPRGTRVIEYVGRRITKAEALVQCEENNEYIFSLNDEVDIDGKVEWNPARFINHSCAPNCEAEVDADHIWIVTCRDISAGEELSFNYGFDLESYKDYPCLCGAKNCLGFMVAEEYFEHVRNNAALNAAG